MMTLDNVLIKFKTNMADQRMDMFVHSPEHQREKARFRSLRHARVDDYVKSSYVCVLESFCVDSEKKRENVLDAK